MVIQEKQYLNKLFVGGVVLFTLIPLYFIWQVPMPLAFLIGVTAILVFTNGLLVLTNLSLSIDEQGISYQLFPFHLRTYRILWSETRKPVIRSYNALTEFGGWGLRYTFGGNKGYIIQGSKGLELELKNGKKILFSITKEQEIATLLQKLG